MILTSIQCVFHWLPVMRGVWGFFSLFAHAQWVYAEMCSHECGGPGEYFGGLRMCLQPYSRDCAGQKHWAELRMHPTTTQLGVFLWMRMFFTLCQSSARWLVERGHVIKVMTYRMLMSHVTLKHNTPIVFFALWLVTTWSSHVYYSNILVMMLQRSLFMPS